MYLNGPVQGGAGELVVVFRVDDDLHDIVGVALKHLTTHPLPVPVPKLDQHVIWTHKQTCTHTHTHTHDHVHNIQWLMFVIYVYIKREREKERESEKKKETNTTYH